MREAVSSLTQALTDVQLTGPLELSPARGMLRGPDRFEVQMLYGVPRTKLLGQLVAQGVVSRLYVPFALSWPQAVAYLRRRLDEYPAMMFVVLKNLFARR